jgi:hypothetical protein
MIIQSTRISRESGVENLERHLLDKDDDNELIEVLAGDRAALYDAHAYANLKRCRYALRHWSISPELDMTPSQLADFLAKVDAEFRIGRHRPRLVVRHIKSGRQHFHVVVGEVDPISSRVLDCRNDYQRLESLARGYERTNGETVQADRSDHKTSCPAGLSQLGRKRAERIAPKFDRTRLKRAFASGADDFERELAEQGLRIVEGHKCPILVTKDGLFAAAAHRACGVRLAEFRIRLLHFQNQPRRTSAISPQGVSLGRPLTKREIYHLASGKVDYDELLERALEMAEAMRTFFGRGADVNSASKHAQRTKEKKHHGSRSTPRWSR